MRGRLRLLAISGQAALVYCCTLVGVDAQTTLRLRGPDAGVGARSTALANAYVAEAFDASTLYWNPAALVFLHQPAILVDYARTVENSTFHYAIVAPLRLNEDISVALGGVAYNWTPDEQTGERQREYSVDIAAAHRFGYSLSLGLSTKLHFAELSNTQVLAAFTSLGIFYAPTPEISYGLVYEGMELVSSFRRWDNTADVIRWEARPRRFALGIAMRYPSSRSDQLLTISVSNEKQIGLRGLFYKMGIEVLPWQFLALRTGFLTGPEAESLRYGVGIRTSPIETAYAYVPYGMRGRYHQLSVFINIQ